MKQPKPILVVRTPNLSIDEIDGFIKKLEMKAPDYHCFCVPSDKTKEIAFETYNCKDATNLNLKELKELLLKEIK